MARGIMATPSVYRTRGLGTIAELVVTDGSCLVRGSEILEQELDRIDRIASRFRPDSELSRLNARAGHEVRVSQGLFEALEVALGMARATDGLVDPTVGLAMEHLGYDRDFADVAGGLPDGSLPDAAPVPGWRRVSLDAGRCSVELPSGAAVDLGATGKALAADRTAATIHRTVGCGVLVSLGGDVAVAGPAPDGGFAVGIDERCTARCPAESVGITSGGLASSGTTVRRWRLGTHQVHHIVDPASGLPAETCWRTVTVAAASCVEANAASTASVVLGDAAVQWLASHRLPARLVRADGTVTTTPGWPAPARLLATEVRSA